MSIMRYILTYMFFQTLNLESDDDVNNFMKGFGHALKL